MKIFVEPILHDKMRAKKAKAAAKLLAKSKVIESPISKEQRTHDDRPLESSGCELPSADERALYAGTEWHRIEEGTARNDDAVRIIELLNDIHEDCDTTPALTCQGLDEVTSARAAISSRDDEGINEIVSEGRINRKQATTPKKILCAIATEYIDTTSNGGTFDRHTKSTSVPTTTLHTEYIHTTSEAPTTDTEVAINDGIRGARVPPAWIVDEEEEDDGLHSLSPFEQQLYEGVIRQGKC